MVEFKGTYGNAKVFTDNIDEGTISDIYKILNSPVSKDANVRFMPDIHKGASCPIGTTMKITDKVIPYFIGVDINCGMLCQELKESHVELTKLDKIIHQNVPSGFSSRESAHKFADEIDLTELHCVKEINIKRALLSVGSLGGGNHFIELNKDEDGKLYLVIHTGSRNLGKQIADYYQNLAFEQMKSNQITKSEIVTQLIHLGKEDQIERILKTIDIPKIDKSMAYCTGELMEQYLHDMDIAQKYASLNRKAIADVIQRGMGWHVVDEFETIHNYIEMSTMILRKGAVSANKGERLIVPISPSFGSLICIGLGNDDWNFSAPHGGGRAMSRKAAKEKFTTVDFKKAMEGVFTTTISKDTIDECPMAYKDPQEIIENIKDTVNVVNHIVPVYNFKGSEESDNRSNK